LTLGETEFRRLLRARQTLIFAAKTGFIEIDSGGRMTEFFGVWMRRTMAAGGVVVSLAFGAAGAHADPRIPLAAHRAVYDLSLLSAKGDSAPASARGRIVFEFNGSACEGYSVEFRQYTEMQSSEGRRVSSDSRSATFEDADAKNFTFKIETVNNGRPAKVIDGRAMKSEDGALSIALRGPAQTKVDLDQDVAFPTEQINRILDAARGGKRTLQMKVFDGSETGQKIFSTLTVIGKPRTTRPSEKAAQIEALAGMRRWPVVVSYFDLSKGQSTPDYVLSFDLYENGISGALRLDYGGFVLKGEMTGLELHKQKACDK
jgi:hypothetical protein